MCLAGTQETVAAAARDQGLNISRRDLLFGGAAAAAAAMVPLSTASARTVPAKRSADLTHTFSAGFPVYAFSPPTRHTLVTVENDGFYAQRWTFGEHSGTHMDAPGHFVSGGRRTPEITPTELIVPVSVIDISARAATDHDAVVTVNDLRAYERRHGRIPDGAGVFMYSGWEERLGHGDAFRNPDNGGTYHFPGFSLEAAEWLLTERTAACIGVDTLSLDHGPSTSFSVHLRWLGADRYGLENLANLSSIPPRGATAIVGVVPWEQGSGGPARVLALW